MSLAYEILNEINNVDSLVASELTAADIVPHLPARKMIKKAKSGVCDVCGLWDSNLSAGACHVCNRKYRLTR